MICFFQFYNICISQSSTAIQRFQIALISDNQTDITYALLLYDGGNIDDPTDVQIGFNAGLRMCTV